MSSKVFKSSKKSSKKSSTRSVNKSAPLVLAHTYDVWISGTKLDMTKKECISSIDIKETVEGSDVATIKINDPEFTYLEDDIFVQDNKIKIKFGFTHSTYRVTFNGYISTIDASFPETGIPVLTVTCMDNTHKMNRKKNSNTFKNCTSAEVVKKIVTKYGFKCVIDSSYKFSKEETITQSNQTDIDFIQKLAGDEVYPFTARLVGNTFYYVRKGKLSKSLLTLNYMQYPNEVISIDAKLNKETIKKEVKSSKVDTSSKKVTTSTSKKDTKDGSASSTGSTNKESRTYNHDGTWTKNK